MAEANGVYLPKDQYLENTLASNRMAIMIHTIMMNATIRENLTNVTQANYTAIFIDPQYYINHAGLGDVWPIPPTQITSDRQVQMVFQIMATRMSEDLQNIHNSLLASTMVTYTKRGTITSQKANKIMKDVILDTGSNISIDPSLIDKFYKFASKFINDQNVPILLNATHETLGDVALRLKLTLEQAKFGGLTQLL